VSVPIARLSLSVSVPLTRLRLFVSVPFLPCTTLTALDNTGHSSTAVSFYLPDRPMPPGRPDVTAAAGRSVTLCWTEPVDDGGCKIGNYIVEYYRVRRGWKLHCGVLQGKAGTERFGRFGVENGLLATLQ
jgi:hypothetical protein